METRAIDLSALVIAEHDENLEADFAEMIRLEMEWIETGDDEAYRAWQELSDRIYTNVATRREPLP